MTKFDHKQFEAALDEALAKRLEISVVELQAFRTFLEMLEAGVIRTRTSPKDWAEPENGLPKYLDMRVWRCGTVACIRGWVEALCVDKNYGRRKLISDRQALLYLAWGGGRPTAADTAQAVRNFLNEHDDPWRFRRSPSEIAHMEACGSACEFLRDQPPTVDIDNALTGACH